ncbi:heavy metal-binding domain-containing protein, partial [Escherichia coli]|uniref:heavy metal-binding domain-containing protein n=1 Tax=Escherichia coli TaxID=562 RepID=UPI000CCA7267
MKVSADAHKAVSYEGVAHYFCSTRCMDRFRANPLQYLSAGTSQPAPPPTSEGTTYTCPMHPEIRQPVPGNCPICGMALEPVIPALEEEDNP